MLSTDLITRVRAEIGDPAFAFRDVTQSDGVITQLDLSEDHVNTNGFSITTQQFSPTVVTSELVFGVDYILDADNGMVQLNTPVSNGSTIIVEGTSWDMFSDDEISTYCGDAINWHVYNRVIQERYRTAGNGFIGYRDTPINLDNLPPVEEPLIVMLATINIFWVLANDATTDTDVQTAEGTNLSRHQRYEQIMNQIHEMTDRYEFYCMQLNVGVYAIEVTDLRRVSQTTGRLIPLFKPREYDDSAYPTRLLPPVIRRYEDNSGIPSALFYGVGGP